MPTTIHEFFIGDDIDAVCTIRKNGQILNISLSAIVKAAIIDNASKTLFGPVACTSAAQGADWENGIVVANFPAALTNTLLPGRATLEIEIDDSGRQTLQQDSILVKQAYIT